MLNAFES